MTSLLTSHHLLLPLTLTPSSFVLSLLLHSLLDPSPTLLVLHHFILKLLPPLFSSILYLPFVSLKSMKYFHQTQLNLIYTVYPWRLFSEELLHFMGYPLLGFLLPPPPMFPHIPLLIVYPRVSLPSLHPHFLCRSLISHSILQLALFLIAQHG